MVRTRKGSQGAVNDRPRGTPTGLASSSGRVAAGLVAWADSASAVAGIGGLGYLPDWRLIAAGERMVDVQPKLCSPVRLLSSESASKTTPTMSCPRAVAALPRLCSRS